MYSWSFIASVFYENVDRCGVFCNHLSKGFVLIIESDF